MWKYSIQKVKKILKHLNALDIHMVLKKQVQFKYPGYRSQLGGNRQYINQKQSQHFVEIYAKQNGMITLMEQNKGRKKKSNLELLRLVQSLKVSDRLDLGCYFWVQIYLKFFAKKKSSVYIKETNWAHKLDLSKYIAMIEFSQHIVQKYVELNQPEFIKYLNHRKVIFPFQQSLMYTYIEF